MWYGPALVLRHRRGERSETGQGQHARQPTGRPQERQPHQGHQQAQRRRQTRHQQHLSGGQVADRQVVLPDQRHHRAEIIGKQHGERNEVKRPDGAHNPRHGIGGPSPQAGGPGGKHGAARRAADQHGSLHQRGDRQEMRLEGKREARNQRRRHPSARFLARHPAGGDERIGQRPNRHQVLALTEIIAGVQQEQQRQNVEIGAPDRCLARPVPRAQREPPAPQAVDQEAELQGARRIQRRDRGDPGREQVEHEDQRRIDVDQVGVEALAPEPPLRKFEDGGDVVVQRRAQHDGQEDEGRQQGPGQPNGGPGDRPCAGQGPQPLRRRRRLPRKIAHRHFGVVNAHQ